VDLQDDAEFVGVDNDVVSEVTSAGQPSSWWTCHALSPSHHLHPIVSMPGMFPLPTVLGPSCGTSLGLGGFGWETGRYSDFAATM